MYAREVKGKTLTFAVSGLLWNHSLVMIDSETNSLWSHLLGKAMAGELMGTQLKTLPGLMTDWKTWRERHPETTVVTLSRTSHNYLTEFYQSSDMFVVGLVDGGQAKSWSFDLLAKKPVINDVLDERPLLIAFDSESSTAFVYNRQAADQTLEFLAREGQLIDRQTESIWDPATGHCEQGDLEGQALELIPAIVSFRHTWLIFHPDTQTNTSL